jgi:predicted dehydrogenase
MARLFERNGRTRRPLGVAVIGLGYWGPNLVRNLHEVAEAEVIAVCDASPERLEPIARRYPVVRTTTSFAALLEDPEVEAVAIATPVSTHFELSAAALEAGKHVFVEKPFAASSEEARYLITLADERRLLVMPGHTFLYSPPVEAVRKLIAAEELGEIYFISASRVNLGLHQSDVSVAWDLAPHDFSILRYWLDETPAYVAAMSRSCIIPGVPDVAFVNLEFAGGIVAHVELSWLSPSKLRRTTIVGSEKMVVYDDTSNEPVRVFDSGAVLPDPENFGEYRLTYRTGDIVSPRVDAAEPLQLEMTDFCRSILAGSTPRCTAELGFDVVRMIEAVDASLDDNGARVRVGGQAGRAGEAFSGVPSAQAAFVDGVGGRSPRS